MGVVNSMKLKNFITLLCLLRCADFIFAQAQPSAPSPGARQAKSSPAEQLSENPQDVSETKRAAAGDFFLNVSGDPNNRRGLAKAKGEKCDGPSSDWYMILPTAALAGVGIVQCIRYYRE